MTLQRTCTGALTSENCAVQGACRRYTPTEASAPTAIPASRAVCYRTSARVRALWGKGRRWSRLRISRPGPRAGTHSQKFSLSSDFTSEICQGSDWQTFWKVSPGVALCCKCSRALTFENLWQATALQHNRTLLPTLLPRFCPAFAHNRTLLPYFK